ncbi:MAG: Uncharacterised protein [Halieaceae bacterium]|nr:MAG: Uncharacterised protein [Halieaceae bacterium]
MGRVQLDARKSRVDQHLGAPRKPCDHRLNILFGHGFRLPKLPSRQSKFYGRRRLGMRINNLLALPTRVADLRPEMIPAAGASGRPSL